MRFSRQTTSWRRFVLRACRRSSVSSMRWAAVGRTADRRAWRWRQRLPLDRGDALEGLPLLVGHIGLQYLDDALAADDAGQRHHGAETRIVEAGGEDRTLVAQDHFGDACREHADAVLAGADAFDDGDVGEAHVLLDSLAERIELDLAAGEQVAHRHAADPGRGPQEHARRAVLAHDIGLHAAWAHAQSLRDMKAEAQTV